MKATTNTAMVYSETERYPLAIHINLCIIKFWFKILNSDVHKLIHIYVAIAELFKDKYPTLYNSVSSSSNSMKALHERIRGKIASQCDTCVNPSLHTHSVSITDVIKAVKK